MRTDHSNIQRATSRFSRALLPPLTSSAGPGGTVLTMSGASLALAGANVIMQLSRASVGHGVVRGSVPSGALTAHPLKRTRTTLGYVTVALFGDDLERDRLRRAVNAQHRLVRSVPGDPVPFNAFDPEAQRWVAACMTRGVFDATTWLYGEQPEGVLDEIYVASSRFATTLQVAPDQWPPDRVAFEQYWAGPCETLAWTR